MKTVIPIIMQPATENYFWVKNVLDGITASAARYDCELLVIGRGAVQKKNLPQNVPILVNGHLSEWLCDTAMFLCMSGYTPVIINASYVNLRRCKYSSVILDMASGIRDVMDYCTFSKRRNVVLFGVRKNVAGDEEKVRLFRQITEEYELEDSSVIYMEDTLEHCIQNFVQFFFDSQIDTVICSNDTVAVFLIRELKKNSVRIPEDVLVAGVGDSMVGRLIGVPLISLTADYVAMGKQAVRLWRYLYRDGTDVNITVSIACQMKWQNVTADFVPQQRYLDYTQEDGGHEGIGNDYFNEDEMVRQLYRLESLLQSCDEMDLALLQAILQEKSDETIAEEVWMTPRAIRYRLNKMMKKVGTQSRSEIVALLREFNVEGVKE